MTKLSSPNAQKGKAVIVVARRLDDMRSGSSQYLKTYLEVCHRVGLSTTVVFAPRRSFGNVAWAKIHPDILNLATDIRWGRTIRFRGRYVSTAGEVWWRCIKRIATEISRRLRKTSDVPIPSLLGAPLDRKEADETIAQLSGLDPQVVTAEYSSIAPILSRCANARRVVLLHDLFSLRAQNFRAQGKTPDHVEISLNDEAARCQAADLIVHASCTELEHFKPALPDAEHVWMRPGVQTMAHHKNPHRDAHAVFVGSVHAGNVGGLEYLRQKVWPRVREQLPDAELHIVGSIANTIDPVHAQQEGLRLIGVVEDLASIGGPQAIGLAPAQFGSGIPIKIVDYLALGISIVTTSETMAAFGNALDGVVLEASSEAEFAEIVVGLLSDERLRNGQFKGTQSVKMRLDNGPLETALTQLSAIGGHELL